MNKKNERETIFSKYNGRCAFCGCQLEKGWHIWDVLPIKTVVTESGELEKINIEQDNLMPACKECGSVRIKNQSGKMDIEDFRTEIIRMYLFVRNDAMYSSSYRRALRFGLVKEMKDKVTFYFETVARSSCR